MRTPRLRTATWKNEGQMETKVPRNDRLVYAKPIRVTRGNWPRALLAQRRAAKVTSRKDKGNNEQCRNMQYETRLQPPIPPQSHRRLPPREASHGHCLTPSTNGRWRSYAMEASIQWRHLPIVTRLQITALYCGAMTEIRRGYTGETWHQQTHW